MKNKVRQEMKILRDKLSPDIINKLSDNILNKLKTIDLCNYDKVFVYNSFSSEVDTKQIIKFFADAGNEVYLPRVEDNMVSVKITKNTTFKQNSFGILEPQGGSSVIDNFVAIMPCLAVDKCGNRIGYGRGYYDKFLEGKSALKIAICYDFQIVDEITSDKYDVKVDYVVSDKKIIKI